MTRRPELTAVFSASFLGGAELFNLEYLQRVRERDVAIDVILPGRGTLLDPVSQLARSVQVVESPGALTALSRFDHRIDLTTLPGGVRAAASYARRLFQAVQRTAGPVCCMGFRAQLALGCLVPSLSRPVAWVVHEVIPRGPFGRLWQLCSRRVHTAYALSAAAAYQPALSARLVELIPARMALAAFAGIEPPSPPPRVLGLIGDLVPIKNHEAFLNLVTALRRSGHEVRGLLVGRPHQEQPGYRARIEGLVANSDGAIELTEASPGEMPDRVAEIDVLLHLTTVPESFGRVCVEAMAAARPVVAFDHGAVADVVSSAQGGLLCPPGDLAAVERAVTKLIEDPRAFAALSGSARERALSSFATLPDARTIGDALAELATESDRWPIGY